MCNCTSENPWRHTCCREEWILRCAIAHHSLRLPAHPGMTARWNDEQINPYRRPCESKDHTLRLR
jgi:hypothetical protein